MVFNLMQFTEIKFGNPEGYMNITGHATVDEHANNFLDSHVYQMSKNLTMLPNYEAIAYDVPSDMRLHVPTDYPRLGRVVYLEEDAEFFVLLYFIASLFALASSCFCQGMTDVEYEMVQDAEANVTQIRGAIDLNDPSAQQNYQSAKGVATVGYYSSRVSSKAKTFLVLLSIGMIVNTARLYYQSEAVKVGLTKSHGQEYSLWYQVAVEDVPLTEAMKSMHDQHGGRKRLLSDNSTAAHLGSTPGADPRLAKNAKLY